MTSTETKGRTEKSLRRYPPLAFLAIVLLITAMVLPSALNLPQANPSTVLEYAPVPPEDEEPPPSAEGSISTLGLGSTSGLTTGAPPPVPQVEQGKAGSGARPVTKRCVGKPLRQTEDPNAPPCVPFFEGDNGGATWQGVKENEIIAIVYSSAYTTVPDNRERRNESTPASGSFCDVDGPANTSVQCLEDNASLEDHSVVRITRAMSKYFNDRFQTYNRHVHFYVFFSSASNAAGRRSDGAAMWSRLKPFAVIDHAFFGGFNEVFAEAAARRRVSVYGAYNAFANSYYQSNAPYIWSFWPDVEHYADMFTSYICKKVAPFKVSHSGMSEDMGKTRRYGLMSTTDEDFAGLKYFAELVEIGIRNCPNGAPMDIRTEVTYSRNQYQVDSGPDAPAEAEENVAKLDGADVTTVLWLGGYETQHSLAADRAGFYPEWVVAGDLLNDTIENGRAQQQNVWRHAWMITNLLREDQTAGVPARQAYREAERNPHPNDEDDATVIYRPFFSLFKAIQVAGPHLTPQTVDQGHHAIPKQASTNPYIAACFYDPGDSTCVKDAMENWWDPDAPDPYGTNFRGCYRMVRAGKRYLAGTWEGTDADVFANKNDLCNTSFAHAFLGTPLD